MAEGKRPFRPLGARHNYPHLLGFFDNGEKFINVDLADLSQKLKTETASDHRGGGKHELFVVVEPLQPATDDQAHVHRDIALVEIDVGAELASVII